MKLYREVGIATRGWRIREGFIEGENKPFPGSRTLARRSAWVAAIGKTIVAGRHQAGHG